MSGFLEINKFGQAWRGTQNFQVTSTGNFIFSANVAYNSSSRGTERAGCTVQIFRNSMKDGEIEIYESGGLRSETHHLNFSEKWQEYLFDKSDESLLITGSSPKMGGEYSVRISPNGLVPKFI